MCAGKESRKIDTGFTAGAFSYSFILTIVLMLMNLCYILNDLHKTHPNHAFALLPAS